MEESNAVVKEEHNYEMFSYFSTKHMLWLLIRNFSNEYPQYMLFFFHGELGEIILELSSNTLS